MNLHEVFLVDDDSDDRIVFEMALREIDPSIQFSYAKNGLEELETLLKSNASSVFLQT